MLYGKKSRLLPNMKYNLSVEGTKGIDELWQRMVHLCSKARVLMRKKAEQRKKAYDKRNCVEVCSFRQGQLVMMKNHQSQKGINKKLAPNWKGLFKIKTQVNDVNWEIESKDRTRKVVHANILKDYMGQSENLEILRGRGSPPCKAENGVQGTFFFGGGGR